MSAFLPYYRVYKAHGHDTPCALTTRIYQMCAVFLCVLMFSLFSSFFRRPDFFGFSFFSFVCHWHKRCLPPVAVVKMASLISAPIPTDYLTVMVEESNYLDKDAGEVFNVGTSTTRDGDVVENLINQPELQEEVAKCIGTGGSCAYLVVSALNNDVKKYMAEGWVPVGPSSLTITPTTVKSIEDEVEVVQGEKIVAIQTMVKY
jgi:hypothetical protein